MLIRCFRRHASLLLAAPLLALLVGCASTTPGGLRIDRSVTATGQDSRVMFLVLHYTVIDTPRSLRVLSRTDVSSHYLLTDESPPRIYQLVDEDRRAWHAGASAWRGSRNLNASSIGIEIVNAGFVDTPQGRVFAPYSDAQIDALIPLVQDIVRRHKIQPERVIGHSDIAPQRKQDPGPAFPWKRLADLGLIPPWPDAASVAAQRAAYEFLLPDVAWFQRALAQQGYEVPTHGALDVATRNVIAAFQMKYRPARYDGEPDAETAALLSVLAAPRTSPAPAGSPEP